MRYSSVVEISTKWGISERSVRNYCSSGKVPGSVLDGKTWKIPSDAVKPARKKREGKIPSDILSRLKAEKESGITGGIYHKVQIELTYNSNNIEGSRLTHDQTRYIFETNTIGIQDDVLNVDDIADGGFTRKVMRHLPASLEYVALYLQVAASSAAVYMMLHYIDWGSLMYFGFLSMGK